MRARTRRLIQLLSTVVFVIKTRVLRMHSRLFVVFLVALACVDGSNIHGNKATMNVGPDNYTNKVLIEYDGTVEEAKEFGNNNNLKFLRHVVRSFYEFRIVGAKQRSNSPVEWDVNGLKGRDKKLKSAEQEKVHYMVTKSVLRERIFSNATEVFHQRFRRAITVNDAKWSNQWHLQTSQNPSMGIEQAWNKGFTGSGITLAIVDDGIDTSHIDLNYDAALSYNFMQNIADPNHINGDEGHGTNCAGVAAALKNSECVIGTAYEANLAGLRLLDSKTGMTPSDEAAALTYKLSDIDIYSNSWGPTDSGITVDELPSVVNAAFVEGVEHGRGGKGAIYVWASGNGGDLSDDCQADGYTISMYTIAIAAVSKSGTPTSYSEHCSAVMAAAYSGNIDSDPNDLAIITTGPSNTCVDDFDGTSAACPLAAGIIALMLQANDALTWRDVQHLIVKTSVSAGLTGGFYSNGAGKQVSPYFGFGLMNAENLVDSAASWETVPPRILCYAFSTESRENSNGVTITDIIDLSKCKVLYTEHVTIKVTFQSSYRGDTNIKLKSPASTVVTVLGNRTLDDDAYQITWSLMTVHFWGESAAGSWSVTLYDVFGGNNMNLYSWELTVYGTVTDPVDGTPSAGSLGGKCTESGTCSGYMDAGCLKPGLVCVPCNNGFRTVHGYCREDGTEGGFCDVSILCQSITGGLECKSNICVTSESSSANIGLIVGVVVGVVMGLILIGIVIYVVWQKIGKMKVQPFVNNGADRNAGYTNAGYEHTSGLGGSSKEGTVHRSTAGGPTIVGHSNGATYNLPPISNAHTFS